MAEATLAAPNSSAIRKLGMIDAVERVTGRVPYTIDVRLPGMLHAKVLRSTMPHARIARLDVSRARGTPGVAAVLTGADLVGRHDLVPWFGPVFRDEPILAIDKVRYVGEPVVAVAADDADSASEALDRVEIEYEELPAVFTIAEALAENAPVLHERSALRARLFTDVVLHDRPGTNICNEFRIRKGDVEVGFSEADHIFEDTFSSPPVHGVPLETHACVANVEAGQVTVVATSQTPFVLRTVLAEVLGLPASRIRVIVPTLGGGFGSKAYPCIEPLTTVLSIVARRPVRYHLTREEEFQTITKHGMEITLTTGVTRDGRITARRARGYFNTGAYANIGPRLIIYGGFGTSGPYAIPHMQVDSYAIYSNIVPAGALRGYGINEAGWAHETQMDMIAERLGMDPAELRYRNLIGEGDTFSTGDVVEDPRFRELLAGATKWIGWRADEPPTRNGSKVRAKGLSTVICRAIPLAVSTALAKLNDDGSLEVLTSSVEMGQGLRTALAIIAGDVLALDPTDIRVSTVDTAMTPYDQQTSASRSTMAMGGAVRAASSDIRSQLLDLAADALEISPTDLETADGAVRVKGDPSRVLPYGDLVRRSRSGNLIGTGRHRSRGGLDAETGQSIGPGPGGWHQSAGAAEVEVDLETGHIEVLRYYAGVYAGRVVNPVQAELQTEGCVALGLGQALFEEMHFDGGQLQNGNLADYMICSINDLPGELRLGILEDPDTSETHGLGEPSTPPVMPAVGNAVYRATGVRITDLPITPEKVLRGLREVRVAPSTDLRAQS